MRVIECVPNFSEGRNKAVIDAISEALQVPGARLLDYSWDYDHNRCVMTVVGEPEAVAEAAFRGVKVAVDLIDMEKHDGDHPRMGAADVVPFVPVRGVTLEDCVRLAKGLGERIGRELQVPVYLYGDAAPERRMLADVRRGQYEGLKSQIVRPERRPDFGPCALHPSAGATAVGARNPLVAFNVNLATVDMNPARAIARAVRASSGGFPHVMATAVNVRRKGEVQVSMNLTDPSITSIHKVFEFIRHEAMALGVEVSGSEIIGLVPLDALMDTLRVFLRLEGTAQVLEARLLEGLFEEVKTIERGRPSVERGATGDHG